MPLGCRENTVLDFENEIAYLKDLELDRSHKLLDDAGVGTRDYSLDQRIWMLLSEWSRTAVSDKK